MSSLNQSLPESILFTFLSSFISEVFIVDAFRLRPTAATEGADGRSRVALVNGPGGREMPSRAALRCAFVSRQVRRRRESASAYCDKGSISPD